MDMDIYLGQEYVGEAKLESSGYDGPANLKTLITRDAVATFPIPATTKRSM